jgi:hypothetical protein
VIETQQQAGGLLMESAAIRAPAPDPRRLAAFARNTSQGDVVMNDWMKKNTFALAFLALVATPMVGCADSEPGRDPGSGDLAADRVDVDVDVASPGDLDVGSAAQALLPSASEVYILEIKNAGTGCPTPIDTSTTISEDLRSFIVAYNRLGLQIAPAPLVQNINCQSNINLHVPNGFQVSLASVTTRGYAFLPPKVRARETSQYFFAGNPITFSPHSALVGPYDGEFQFDDEVPFSSVVWSACGTSAIFAVNVVLNLNASQNTSVLSPTEPPAIFAAYSTAGNFEKIFHIMWRPC